MIRIRTGLVATLALLLFATNAGAQANLGGAPGGCDKACLRSLADGYFAALVAHDSSKAAMAPGAKFTGMTMFRHPMEEKIFKIYNSDGQLVDRDMTSQRPFDFESIHIFKIQKAQIHEIEAMGISLPLHSKNGWSDFWR